MQYDFYRWQSLLLSFIIYTSYMTFKLHQIAIMFKLYVVILFIIKTNLIKLLYGGGG